MNGEEADRTRVLDESGRVAPPVASAGALAAEQTALGATINCPVCGTVNPGLETYCTECGFLLSSQPGSAVEGEEPGCPFALLDERTGRRYPLHGGDNLIGRETGDVLLVDTTVSRKHAVLSIQGDAVSITDQGSTNGTRVDGTPIPQGAPWPLRAGSLLQLGSVTLRLEGPEGAGPAEVTAAMATADAGSSEELPTAVVQGPEIARLVTDGAHGSDIPIREGVMTVGRRPGNDHVIEGDPFVSGRHARIACSREEVTIEDLGSTNGTFVNGEKLAAGQVVSLAEGDEVAIGRGKYRLVLAGPGQPDASHASDGSEALEEDLPSDDL